MVSLVGTRRSISKRRAQIDLLVSVLVSMGNFFSICMHYSYTVKVSLPAFFDLSRLCSSARLYCRASVPGTYVVPSGKKTSVGPQCERTTPKRSLFRYIRQPPPATSARDTEPLRFGFVGPVSSCHRTNEQMHTPASKPICSFKESIRAVWCDGC
jgi:hypothetical protein